MAFLVLKATPMLVQGIRFAIYNRCSEPIDIYINGDKITATGAETILREFEDGWSGLIYSDANGGSQDGHTGTLRAGFFGDGRYFMVRDPAWINVPFSMNAVFHAESQPSTCQGISCTEYGCEFSAMFTEMPDVSTPVGGLMRHCPEVNPLFEFDFCQAGGLRRRQIKHVGAPRQCVRYSSDRVGPVTIDEDCAWTNKVWFLERTGQINSASLGNCLDAGTDVRSDPNPPPIRPKVISGGGPLNYVFRPTGFNASSGVKVRMWPCIQNRPAQQWIYSLTDRTFRLANTNQCLDLTDGRLEVGNELQTWECLPGNEDQIWLVEP
ncbi:hypothetical protein FA15DRAFT_657639 [Coprinopsis marcescibilis]|uniref:Ricin B lectin domain-containing protein n=1 Tax=Coprinopsis marcescibilis TaxID=230819 RepID=A0A5C3L240_COPMA|nr:hypothetical protein FA15DRAFT_657639 [Coprinopsis marcescibilis]